MVFLYPVIAIVLLGCFYWYWHHGRNDTLLSPTGVEEGNHASPSLDMTKGGTTEKRTREHLRQSYDDLMAAFYACYDAVKKPMAGDIPTFDAAFKQFQGCQTFLDDLEEPTECQTDQPTEEAVQESLLKTVRRCEKSLIQLKQSYVALQAPPEQQSAEETHYTKQRYLRCREACLTQMAELTDALIDPPEL